MKNAWMRLVPVIVIGMTVIANPVPGAADEPLGRYRVTYSPHGPKETFLLDTQTGRTWQLYRDPDINADYWREMTREDYAESILRIEGNPLSVKIRRKPGAPVEKK